MNSSLVPCLQVKQQGKPNSLALGVNQSNGRKTLNSDCRKAMAIQRMHGNSQKIKEKEFAKNYDCLHPTGT